MLLILSSFDLIPSDSKVSAYNFSNNFNIISIEKVIKSRLDDKNNNSENKILFRFDSKNNNNEKNKNKKKWKEKDPTKNIFPINNRIRNNLENYIFTYW